MIEGFLFPPVVFAPTLMAPHQVLTPSRMKPLLPDRAIEPEGDDLRPADVPASRTPRFTDPIDNWVKPRSRFVAAACQPAAPKETQPVLSPKKEKDQLALAQYGDNLSCDRPDPNDPGGLGAEESGIERTGPTQGFLLPIQHGSRWAEVGRYYDSANDPVTAQICDGIGFLAQPGTAGCGRSSIPARWPLAAEAGRRNHVAHGMIPKSGIRFSERTYA